MSNLLRVPLRAGHHLAVWLIWQSTGRSHVADLGAGGVPGVQVVDSGSRAA